MGAVNFSIDSKLLDALFSVMSLDVFIETGTFEGATIEIANRYFEKIYSIELSSEYYEKASTKYKEFPKIKCIHGDSSVELSNIIQNIKKTSVLFWLDAHWCVAKNTAGQLSQCPLLDELDAIGSLNSESIILIDDARLYLAPPPAPHEVSQWPCIDDIAKKLYEISSIHNLMIVNDVIIYYPKSIKNTMFMYAQQYGSELYFLNKAPTTKELLKSLEEKEQMIKLLKKVCDEREELIFYLSKKQAKKTN